MNRNTLVVIGLDAADYEIAKRWECSNILLENHHELETFAHTKDYPITAEVWPTIATGKMPDEGGQGGKRGSDWGGMMGLANRVAKMTLPKSTRAKIGRYLRNGKEVDSHFDPTGDDHLFGNGAVYNWPGITPAQNWARSEHWLEEFNNGEISDIEFLRRQIAFTGEELGWAIAMSRTWLPIVGTRCHILDHTGHAWCKQEDKLRIAYEMVDEMIEILLCEKYVGDIIIVSDHGIQVSCVGDSNPGMHSWRAMFGTNIDGILPDHVKEVRKWIQNETPEPPEIDGSWFESNMNTPTEHLKDLGYIQ